MLNGVADTSKTKEKTFGKGSGYYATKHEKRDITWELRLLQWIEAVIEEPVPNQHDIFASLKTGVILCKLINKLLPNFIKKFNTEDHLHMLQECENIEKYLDACWRLGMASSDMFVLQDLYSGRCITKVSHNIHALNKLSPYLTQGLAPKGDMATFPLDVNDMAQVDTKAKFIRFDEFRGEDSEVAALRAQVQQLKVCLSERTKAATLLQLKNDELQLRLANESYAPKTREHRSKTLTLRGSKSSKKRRSEKRTTPDKKASLRSSQRGSSRRKLSSEFNRSDMSSTPPKMTSPPRDGVRHTRSNTNINMPDLDLKKAKKSWRKSMRFNKKSSRKGSVSEEPLEIVGQAPLSARSPGGDTMMAKRLEEHIVALSKQVETAKTYALNTCYDVDNSAISDLKKDDADLLGLKRRLEIATTTREGDSEPFGFFYYEKKINKRLIFHLRDTLMMIFTSQQPEEMSASLKEEYSTMLTQEQGKRIFLFLFLRCAEAIGASSGNEISLVQDSFDVLLYFLDLLLTDVEERVDFLMAKTVLEYANVICCKSKKSVPLREFIRGHRVWLSLAFWEQYFWDGISTEFTEKIGGDDIALSPKIIAYTSRLVSRALGYFVGCMTDLEVAPQGIEQFFDYVIGEFGVSGERVKTAKTDLAALVEEQKIKIQGSLMGKKTPVYELPFLLGLKKEKEGYLAKKGAFVQHWKKLWFILHDYDMYYLRKKPHSSDRFVDLGGVISLKDATISPDNDSHPGKRHSFYINTKVRKYWMQAPSSSSCDSWKQLLRRKIDLWHKLQAIERQRSDSERRIFSARGIGARKESAPYSVRSADSRFESQSQMDQSKDSEGTRMEQLQEMLDNPPSESMAAGESEDEQMDDLVELIKRLEKSKGKLDPDGSEAEHQAEASKDATAKEDVAASSSDDESTAEQPKPDQEEGDIMFKMQQIAQLSGGQQPRSRSSTAHRKDPSNDIIFV